MFLPYCSLSSSSPIKPALILTPKTSLCPKKSKSSLFDLLLYELTSMHCWARPSNLVVWLHRWSRLSIKIWTSLNRSSYDCAPRQAADTRSNWTSNCLLRWAITACWRTPAGRNCCCKAGLPKVVCNCNPVSLSPRNWAVPSPTRAASGSKVDHERKPPDCP